MPTLRLPADPPLALWPSSGVVGILDLEYTAWDGSAQRGWSQPWEWREIVQVGVLLVDAGRSFSACDEMEIMVRPQRNSVLSEYFTSLTGITQKRLEEGALSFDEMLTRVSEFVARVELVMFNGCDGQVLRENCVLNMVTLPWLDKRMFDFRPLLARTLGRPQEELISSELPRLAGTRTSGRSHSALDDCKAIAAALAAWRSSGIL